YEVTINEYYGMPMDPLDPYVQLVMRAPLSPDYIPGPEGNSIDYPTSEGDNDADDDGDDLLEDDNEDEEESSDSEEEEEEHLALTVPAP
nr:hypothetical protein [Tanacetum cinerariifolium]